jgi:hypothetical protein
MSHEHEPERYTPSWPEFIPGEFYRCIECHAPMYAERERPVCRVCDWQRIYARGRCRSCYVFERRHGRDRTEDEVVAQGQAYLERRDSLVAR